MKTITIRQKTEEEGFKKSCSPSSVDLPYIIEIDGQILNNVRKFELTLDNDFTNIFDVAEYSVTHYGMTPDDYKDGVGNNEEHKLYMSSDCL